jgi:hypothetical protein
VCEPSQGVHTLTYSSTWWTTMVMHCHMRHRGLMHWYDLSTLILDLWLDQFCSCRILLPPRSLHRLHPEMTLKKVSIFRLVSDPAGLSSNPYIAVAVLMSSNRRVKTTPGGPSSLANFWDAEEPQEFKPSRRKVHAVLSSLSADFLPIYPG